MAGWCYIFGAGERSDLVTKPGAGDLVIAADGGFDYLKALGLTPDVLVADFDSIIEEPDVPGLEIHRLPVEKDDTDTAAAIQLGRERGYTKFALYGGTGGRIDHTFANIQCLAGLAASGARGWLYTPDTVITAIHGPDSVEFQKHDPAFVSVLAYSDACSGVSISGLKYPLANAALRNTCALGVSNEFAGVPARISLEEGTLVITAPRDAREVAEITWGTPVEERGTSVSEGDDEWNSALAHWIREEEASGASLRAPQPSSKESTFPWKGAIFDLDGTLLDTLWIWEQVDVDYLEERGIEVPADYRKAIAALSTSQVAQYSIERFGLSERPEDLVNEWFARAKILYASRAELKPGAVAYLAALHNAGIKLGIATSSEPDLFGPVLERAGVLDFFSAIATSTEAGVGKTQPDVYLNCAAKLGLNPADCIVFEDLIEGIQAASSAGFFTVGILEEAAVADWPTIRSDADLTITTFDEAPRP